MSLRCCIGLTYGEIWQEMKKESERGAYPNVSLDELDRIHRKWRSLSKSVWKEMGGKI